MHKLVNCRSASCIRRVFLINTLPSSVIGHNAHVISLQPGEYIGEYKGLDLILCPRVGENSRDFFKFKGKGWGNS